MSKHTYCLSCKSGSEAALKRELLQDLPEATVLFPVYDHEEHSEGKWIVKTYPLIPGYIFIYSDNAISPNKMYGEKHAIKLLKYSEAICDENEDASVYELFGGDLDYANWVFKYNGHITVSRAVQVGSRTRIIDGPLLDYEGEILKVNRNRRCALVRIAIGEMTKDIWLSLEWMTLKDEVAVN